MPTTITERPYRPVPIDPPRKRWTRGECTALEGTCAWDQMHFELVQGELINKMGKRPPQVICLRAVLTWLEHVFGADFVRPEAPIDVAPEDNPMERARA